VTASLRVVVITGASSGIGAALAELLARKGMSVALVARRAEALHAVTQRCGANAFAIVGDMTSREDVKRVVAQTIERFGHIDVWINNVGQGISRLPSQLSDADIDTMMRVNVKTALYGMQEVLPHFKERNAGHVINISSLLGRLSYSLPRTAYTAAKHFLNPLTANFRDEFRESHPGIQFSIVSPPVVRTDFGNNALHGGVDSRTLPNSQSAEEVAQVIADVIDTREPDVYTQAGSHERVVRYFDSVGTDPRSPRRV
jgi:NADP-dependent 3-hydroxy acid dehydrogenase YdfG